MEILKSVLHCGLAALLLVAAACTFDPESGQFRCEMSASCPSGMTCVSGLCVDESEADAGVDAGTDAGDEDASDGADADGDAADAADTSGALDASDAGDSSDSADVDVDPREVCTSTTPPGTPEDEDEDGNVDEGCVFTASSIHHVPSMTPSPVGDFGPQDLWVSVDGRSALGASAEVGEPILRYSRSSVDAPFGAPVGGVVSTLVVPRQAFVRVSATRDEQDLVVQTSAAFGRRILFFRLVGDVYELQPEGELDRVQEPSIRFDGMELVYLDDDGVVYSVRRSDRSDAFEIVEAVEIGRLGAFSYPTLSPDGLTLFFSQAGAVRYLRRASRDVNFPDSGTSITFFERSTARRVSFVPAGGEVYFMADVALFYAGVMRARACRMESCPEVDPIECDDGQRTRDGVHCMWLEEESTLYDEGCEGGDLASLASEDELEIAREVFSTWEGLPVWTGLNSGLAPVCVGCPTAWSNGEALGWPRVLDGTVDEESPCSFLRTLSGETFVRPSNACDVMRASLCERTQYPSW